MKVVIYVNLAQHEIITRNIEREQIVKYARIISLSQLIDYLFSLFPVDQKIMRTKTRKIEYVDIRRIINYCLFNTHKWSNSTVGKAMGHDHAWVNYHLRKMNDFLSTSERIKFLPQINKVQKSLKELKII